MRGVYKQPFLDANIFFAAVASDKGGSYFILELAKQGKIFPSTSAYALSEAEKNISVKLGKEKLRHHHENLISMPLHIQSTLDVGVDRWIEKMALDYLPGKDAPILISAMNAHSTHLITLDRKHFLNNEDLRDILENVKILTPGDFIKEFLENPESFQVD